MGEALAELGGHVFEGSEDVLRLRVLDAGAPEGLAAWKRVWLAWPKRDVMAHPEYVRLFARPCDRTVCIYGEEARGAVLFPLILRPLSAEPWARPGERRWDAISPYGYGGPYAWGERSRGDAAFWNAYSGWCEREQIVSTFARLSLFPEQLPVLPGSVEERGTNILIGLEGGAESIWKGYDSKVRRWVRTAEREGLEIEIDEQAARLDDFLAIYKHTMERNGAQDWYYFPRSFFEAIVAELRGRYAFVHALWKGKVVSSDLILCSEEHVYYFLGGTLQEAFELGPNYLLKHRVAEWAAATGKKACVLGGGYEPEDGVLRYKRAFSRRGEVPFRVACLTHDEDACRRLASDRAEFEARQGRAWEARAAFFPHYRA